MAFSFPGRRLSRPSVGGTTASVSELLCLTLVLFFSASAAGAQPGAPPPAARGGEDTSGSVTRQIGSRLTPQQVGQLIDGHNRARAEVGVAPLSWSDRLAAYAQQWADRLASKDCDLEHRPPAGEWKQLYGENLFMGTAGHFGVADAVKAWEGEKRNYRGQAIGASDSIVGHYTQMVWSQSRRLGCAEAECRGNLIVVCNYDPPGNVVGRKPY